MGSLGNLTPGNAAAIAGDEVQVLDVNTFEFFDMTVRVNPDYEELAFLDFVEEASTVDEGDPRAMILIKNLMRELVHPDDFERFWRTARKNRQRQQDLAELNNRVLAALSERPTERPAGSSAGPTTTTASSAVSSSAPGTDDVEAATERVIRRHVAAGRPDLALMVDDAREQRSA